MVKNELLKGDAVFYIMDIRMLLGLPWCLLLVEQQACSLSFISAHLLSLSSAAWHLALGGCHIATVVELALPRSGRGGWYDYCNTYWWKEAKNRKRRRPFPGSL